MMEKTYIDITDAKKFQHLDSSYADDLNMITHQSPILDVESSTHSMENI